MRRWARVRTAGRRTTRGAVGGAVGVASPDVLVMDEQNFKSVQRIAKGGVTARIHLLREFDDADDDPDVPDPYYGGPRGFEDVHDIVDRSCAALLRHIRETHAL